MRTILIYDESDTDYDEWIRLEEFDSKEDMLNFVNNNKQVCRKIIAAYEIYGKLKFKPVEKVTSWDVES
ncbi:MAG: hypothetical protein WC910_05225 [Bacteroidales bacterium]|jgi:hypothetical protein